jgi:hypothetical protein
MSLYELLFIFFIGIAMVAWAVGARAKSKEESSRQDSRKDGASDAVGN